MLFWLKGYFLGNSCEAVAPLNVRSGGKKIEEKPEEL